MNPEPPNRESLLDDVFDGPETARAPGIQSVLRLVAAEKLRRHRRRLAVTAAAIPLAVAAVVLTNHPPPAAPVVIVDSAPPPAEEKTVRIERIDDDTLLRLLDDRPVALATYPDGRQSLLVLTRR